MEQRTQSPPMFRTVAGRLLLLLVATLAGCDHQTSEALKSANAEDTTPLLLRRLPNTDIPGARFSFYDLTVFRPDLDPVQVSRGSVKKSDGSIEVMEAKTEYPTLLLEETGTQCVAITTSLVITTHPTGYRLVQKEDHPSIIRSHRIGSGPWVRNDSVAEGSSGVIHAFREGDDKALLFNVRDTPTASHSSTATISAARQDPALIHELALSDATSGEVIRHEGSGTEFEELEYLDAGTITYYSFTREKPLAEGQEDLPLEVVEIIRDAETREVLRKRVFTLLTD